ncbi:MAG: putative quinol monooxygenase [Caldimonas sp.]
MVHVMASIEVKPEHAAAVRDQLVELAGKTRAEAGCVSYELYQRADKPHVFRTVEAWHTQADVDAHMKTPHVAAAIASAGPLLAAPLDIVTFTKVG